ncbi:MAG: pyrroloquinoline quinone biosynthesis peptide chaperone PqqD [Actinobacteria bacterium]|nr:pyrroloquinoline quinone biosynthesis peptide chaperone PqqD [Actinomycetota bacterium]
MAFTRPKLATGVRLHRDKVREQDVLLFPEGALVLNETALEVLDLVDGERTLDDIAAVLSERYEGADVKDDVSELLDGIGERGLVVEADG